MMRFPTLTFIKVLLVALTALRFLVLSSDGVPPTSTGIQAEPSPSLSCPSRCTSPQTRPQQNTFRVFYLIIVHDERTMNDALHLFRAIRDPRNTVLIHVDQKAQHILRNETDGTLTTNRLLQEIESCPCGSTVRIESIYDVQWSKWSMNLPTLWGMQVAVTDYADQWDVFVNLAGDNLPVYTVDVMAERLEQLPYNFVTSSSCETGLLPTSVYLFPSWWHKRAHYTRQDTEADPVFTYTDSAGNQQTTTLVTHFGSQWNILQAGFCRWLVQELQRPDSLPSLFREHLIESGKLMTDETFVPTLLMHVDEFKETLPVWQDGGELLWKNGSSSSMIDVRYERMDEHTPTAFGHFATQQRYRVPESSTELQEPRPWGPYFLGVYDLADIRESGALFIRKVSDHVDHNLLNLFPVNRPEDIPFIEWPDEVAIRPKPDWEKLKAEIMSEALAMQQGEESDDTDEESDDVAEL